MSLLGYRARRITFQRSAVPGEDTFVSVFRISTQAWGRFRKYFQSLFSFLLLLCFAFAARDARALTPDDLLSDATTTIRAIVPALTNVIVTWDEVLNENAGYKIYYGGA